MSKRHKPICVLLAVLLLLLMLAGCGDAQQEQDGDWPLFSSYQEIPGVTAEEIAAIESLRASADAFVLGAHFSTEAFVDVNGEVSGFSAFLCAWLSDLFDLPFTPQLYAWSDLLDGLSDGTIDFTSELTPSAERQQTFFMTGPIAERTVTAFRLSDGASPAAASPRPSRYAFLVNSITVDQIRSALAKIGPYEIVFVQGFEDAYALLQSGEVDAYFTENTARANFEAYGDVIGTPFFPPFFSPTALSTQNPALAPVIDVVQKALAHGADRYLAELYAQGESAFSRNALLANLTETERAYIRDNPVIPYVTQYNNYPMSFFNENDREWQGIAFDLLHNIEMLTGLSFQLAHGDELVRWPYLLEMVETGEAAFVTELIRTEERIGRYLWLDTTLASEYLTLVSEESLRSIGLSEIKNYTVGVVRNTAQTQAFFRWFPSHAHIVEYDDTRDALMGMRRGEVDLVMSSTSNLLVMTNYLELTGFKANIVFDETLQESTIGLNVEQDILRSILDKALVYVDIKATQDEWKNRTFDYRYKLIEAQRPWLFGSILLSLIILILICARLVHSRNAEKQLERLLAERTATLEMRQRELETATVAAEAANRAKSDFLATMSHEIRTPMNSIMGFAELAMSAQGLSSQTESYLNKIFDNAGWLLGIVNDILDISKIESGKMELEQVPFSLQDAFLRCQSLTLPSANKKNLALYVHADPIVGRKLVGDPLRLYQVLMNLLSNAVKFTSSGTVELSARVKDSAQDKVMVSFMVKDTGIGMNTAQIERIFDPFVQADSSSTRNYGGTGLGLAITKNIVDLMGGTLRAESAPGAGSVFHFEICFDTVEADTSTVNLSDFAHIEQPAFNALVLVCDDNPMNQEVICGHLARVGIQSAVAGDGKEGLELVEARMVQGQPPFDLIFMDMFMPVMDGLEAASRITALNTGSPIVAMTANIMASELERYKKHGMPDCLGKPFTSQALWRILLKYLSPVPVDEADAPAASDTAASEDDLQQALQIAFVKNNQAKYAEIENALQVGDLKLAHRLAHTLKGNAGLIGKSALQHAAAAVETILKPEEVEDARLVPSPDVDGIPGAADGSQAGGPGAGGFGVAPDALPKAAGGFGAAPDAAAMRRLRDELDAVLDELAPLLIETRETRPALTEAETLALFEKLEPLLENINPACVDLLDEIKAAPGTEALARHIEAYDFAAAAEALAAIKKKRGGPAA